jgi:hypothetical protein
VLAALFTETGILPLRYRRVTLAIAYLLYLRGLPTTHYAYAALQESKSLLRNGFPCWIADLNWVILNLPGADLPGGAIHVEDMDGRGLLALQKSLVEWCDGHLGQALAASTKCSKIVGGMEILTRFSFPDYHHYLYSHG